MGQWGEEVQSGGRVCNELKYSMKDCHLWTNLAVVPFTEYLIFFFTSLLLSYQRELDGGLGDFHESKIRHLAKRDVKAKTSDCKELI